MEMNSGSGTRPAHTMEALGGKPMGSVAAKSDAVERDQKLDSIIAEADAKAEAEAGELEDFRSSRRERDTISERYGSPDAGRSAIANFLAWDQNLREHGAVAAEALASHYLRNYKVGSDLVRDQEHRANLKSLVDGEPDTRHSNFKLDDIISGAQDEAERAPREREDFAATAEQRAALKERFPGLTVSEAMRQIAKIDGELHKDPLGTAARLAASYGTPVTNLQHEAQALGAEQQQHDANMIAMLQRETASMPGFKEVMPEVISLLKMQSFPRTDDARADLRRAYDTVVAARLEAKPEVEKAKPAARVRAPSYGGRMVKSRDTNVALDAAIDRAMDKLFPDG